MDILITGSSGFLGGRLSNHLSINHEVCRFTGDILSGHIPLGDAVWGKDAVVHLVGLNDATCRKDELNAYNVNVIGTHNIVRRSTEFKKIIYFSTIHVYGYPPSGIITEKSKVNPQSVYAMSHYMAEEMVRNHYKGTVLRLSNGFGCPANDTDTAWVVVVNNICKQAVENKRIILNIDPRELRDFITATDICRAVEHVLDKSLTGVFNVGSGKTTRVLDMANLVAERCKMILGYKPEITLNERHSPELPKEELDYRIDKIKATGYKPLNNYEQEIDNTIRLIRNNIIPV
jgi:UDP-glucose 4-epimerase